MARAAKGTGKINLAPKAKKTRKARNPLFIDEKYTGPEPEWDGWEKWSYEKFRKEKHRGFYYYNYFMSGKEMIPKIIEWMSVQGYSKDDIRAYKAVPDWKTNTTMGSIASMMLRGMPAKHPENDETPSDVFLKEKLDNLILEGKELIKQQKIDEKKNSKLYVPTIQERIREATEAYLEEIEDWLEGFITDPANFNPKGMNIHNYFKTKEINQAHARIIRDYYEPLKTDYEQLLNPPKVKDEMFQQLVEGYSCYTKEQLKNKLAALEEIISAANMFLQQAKVNRKPKAKKAPSKEKLVGKLKFKASDEKFKLVSIKPEDCLQALELWVFNTKTRKLGCYVCEDLQALSIKGTTIINFNENKSVAKTVRKPEEILKDINNLPKTKLRKLYEGIKSVETKLNGRINGDIILVKAYK